MFAVARNGRNVFTRRGIESVGIRSLSSEIPIKQVASVWKFNVKNEENAMIMDGVLKASIVPVLRKQPGFIKAERMVCKNEWAYECNLVFDSLDNFKGWKDSKDYKALMDQTPSNLEKIGLKMEDAYNGARVFDEM